MTRRTYENEFDWDVRDLVLGEPKVVTYFKYKVVTNDCNKLSQFAKLLLKQKELSPDLHKDLVKLLPRIFVQTYL